MLAIPASSHSERSEESQGMLNVSPVEVPRIAQNDKRAWFLDIQQPVSKGVTAVHVG
jgi:hypothetical protein